MKKLFITAAAMLAFVVGNAQLVTVNSIDRVGDVTCAKVTMSPDGEYVVANTGSSLNRVNIADGQSTVLTTGANLTGVTIGADGTVAYVRPSFDKKHLRHVSLEAITPAGQQVVVVKPTRQLGAGVTVANGTVNGIAKGKAQAKAVNGGKTVKAPVAAINYGHLDVTVDGKTRTIDPQGRGSYLWPSVSPDGTKVCYWLVGRGCFTCNLDGTDVKSHGPLRAAVWAGDHMLVGMDELEDTNQEVVASSIVALDPATNTVQKLTDDSIIAQFPSASADGSRIAFTDIHGQVYVINITK